MQFRKATLDNGLNIVSEVNPAAASMAAGFFVRTGSRDETPEVSGVSHFLEHMVFKGTPRREALDVNREFDEMGANYNAFTSEENTVFYGAVLPEFQDRLVDLLSDIMRPSLRQADFDVEKQVILDEIALYEDHPKFRVYDNLMSEYFRGHPLGNVILGTNESITHLTREQMQAYFDRRYAPANITLAGVGNLDFDRFVEAARKGCGHWEGDGADRRAERWSADGGLHAMVDDRLAMEHVGLMSAAPSAQQAERRAAQLAANIVGDSSGSRLYYALVEPAIADDVSTSYSPMDGTGTFLTFLSCGPDRTEEAMNVVRVELERFQKDGPTEAEMTAAKNKIASSLTLRGEVPMGRLSAVGFDWIYRDDYIPLTEEIKKLLAVPREQVSAVAGKYRMATVTTLALGPEKL